jgi:hypothetical protein
VQAYSGISVNQTMFIDNSNAGGAGNRLFSNTFSFDIFMIQSSNN